jgi:hypothetical protein
MAARARELLKVPSDGGKVGSIQNPSPWLRGEGARSLAQGTEGREQEQGAGRA